MFRGFWASLFVLLVDSLLTRRRLDRALRTSGSKRPDDPLLKWNIAPHHCEATGGTMVVELT
jgi:hypothetical protein